LIAPRSSWILQTAYGFLVASIEDLPQSAGKVELAAGMNRLAVERGWGYYDIDHLELVPVK
jgi:hypothetical protein